MKDVKINGNLKSPNLYSQINYAARSPEISASFANDKLSQGSNSTITKIKKSPHIPSNKLKKKKNPVVKMNAASRSGLQQANRDWFRKGKAEINQQLAVPFILKIILINRKVENHRWIQYRHCRQKVTLRRPRDQGRAGLLLLPTVTPSPSLPNSNWKIPLL